MKGLYSADLFILGISAVSAFDVVSIANIQMTMTSGATSDTDVRPTEVLASADKVSSTNISYVMVLPEIDSYS